MPPRPTCSTCAAACQRRARGCARDPFLCAEWCKQAGGCTRHKGAPITRRAATAAHRAPSPSPLPLLHDNPASLLPDEDARAGPPAPIDPAPPSGAAEIALSVSGAPQAVAVANGGPSMPASDPRLVTITPAVRVTEATGPVNSQIIDLTRTQLDQPSAPSAIPADLIASLASISQVHPLAAGARRHPGTPGSPSRPHATVPPAFPPQRLPAPTRRPIGSASVQRGLGRSGQCASHSTQHHPPVRRQREHRDGLLLSPDRHG